MNNCVFVGRLTDDPEIRYVNNEEQLAVARMSIAVDRRCEKGEEKKADFFDASVLDTERNSQRTT